MSAGDIGGQAARSRDSWRHRHGRAAVHPAAGRPSVVQDGLARRERAVGRQGLRRGDEVAALVAAAGRRPRHAGRGVHARAARRSCCSRRSTPPPPRISSRPLPPPATSSSATRGATGCSLTCRWSFPRSTPIISRSSPASAASAAGRGAIVTNPNCSTVVLSMVLAPLRVRSPRVMVTTLQAVSGAGYPGVASLDILGNVDPGHLRRRRKDGERDAEDPRHARARRRLAAPDGRQRDDDARAGDRRAYRIDLDRVRPAAVARRRPRRARGFPRPAAGAASCRARRRRRSSTWTPPIGRSRGSTSSAATA